MLITFQEKQIWVQVLTIKNNFLSLFILLKCVGERNVTELQVFGDSKLVVDWMKESIKLFNLDLQQNGQCLKTTSSYFSMITYMHIYIELNNTTDTLSKEALHFPVNYMVMEELFEGEMISKREGDFYHM
jgi:hypothetical protein